MTWITEAFRTLLGRTRLFLKANAALVFGVSAFVVLTLSAAWWWLLRRRSGVSVFESLWVARLKRDEREREALRRRTDARKHEIEDLDKEILRAKQNIVEFRTTTEKMTAKQIEEAYEALGY